MYPCEIETLQTPGLCTYYAITSLLVVVLAISLIWIPFVQLISEVNTIIAKVVIYFNTQCLGYTNNVFFKGIETVLVSRKSLLTISFCCVSYGVYLASSDFLLSAACFISTLPNTKYLTNVKKFALGVIENILNLRRPRRYYIKKYPKEKYRD